jgi:hypothetical protein
MHLSALDGDQKTLRALRDVHRRPSSVKDWVAIRDMPTSVASTVVAYGTIRLGARSPLTQSQLYKLDNILAAIAVSLAAPPFRNMPMATVQHLNLQRRPNQANHAALRGVVINTLYILSNTNAFYSARFAVRRLKNLF